MTTYIAYFRTDAEYATKEIKAKTPKHALAKARKLADESPEDLYFESYDGGFPVNEIAISPEDGGEELAVWFDADLHLRLAASDLLTAARRVIERWERGDLAEAVRDLASAVAKAEGGAL